jgi:hypothetical protein
MVRVTFGVPLSRICGERPAMPRRVPAFARSLKRMEPNVPRNAYRVRSWQSSPSWLGHLTTGRRRTPSSAAIHPTEEVAMPS